jgi:hypothetical protein
MTSQAEAQTARRRSEPAALDFDKGRSGAGRVLQVERVALDDRGKPTDETAERQLDDRIRVLLPLTLPVPIAEAQDGSGPAMEQLVRALPAGINKALVDAVIAASSAGEDSVTDAVAHVINGAFQSEPGEEQL